MQTCGSNLFARLESKERDLLPVDLFEFYPPEETDLCPANAEKRFAGGEIAWLGWKYERQAITRGDTSRFIDGKFNNVTITLSNVDRTVSTWLATTQLEGYRIIIRCISRSVEDDSVVLGVFRCEKVGDVDNVRIDINAQQDLGSVENDIPFTKISNRCQVKDGFKGVECLAGQALSAKTSTYQAATKCNFSIQQCEAYGNRKAYQGTTYTAVSGNFKVSARRGGAGGALLSLIGLGNKRVTKQYSSQDSEAIGKPWPFGLGRTQIELTPLVYADTGQYLAGQWGAGEGPIQAFLNLRNITAGWANTFQALATHKGEYGYNSEQNPAGFFTSQQLYHSHRAYVEATILGDNPDTGDPAPSLAATIMWTKIPVWNGTSFAGTEWSDNPVDHLRYILTEVRGLNYNPAWIDDVVSGETANYCDDSLLDQSGGEDVYVSTASGTPGTDYKRYRSTGLLDKYYFRKKLGVTSQYSAEREVIYNTFAPGSLVTPTLGTYYRKRYTSNFSIIDFKRAIDFIFKDLLPAFRGYLVTSAQGKLQIRSERPTITSYLRNDAADGATAVQVEDALAWRNLNLPVIFALISVGTATSETAKVSSVSFSTAGNSITLAASGSASASGSTLSGGTTDIQAQGTITVGSVATATVTIDGTAVTYTGGTDDTTGTIAAGLAVRINANATLNRFVQAIWTVSNPTVVIIRSKLGTLNLAAPLEYDHDQLDIVAHVHMCFADKAMGALPRGNISKDGFSWPKGSKQSSYNQFLINYNDAPQDYQPTEVPDNDYDHQAKINKVNKLEISGACVDNYHQAFRLIRAARFKYREGDYFVQIATTDARALLLEEGDVICATHSNQPGQRNILLRVEELRVSAEHRISILGRLYADEQFPQSADERTVPLVTGIGWASTPPGAITNLVLSQPVDGTLRGTFTFAEYIGEQTARIEVKRDGETAFADTGLRVLADATLLGAFEIPGLTLGTASVRLTPYSVAGDGPQTEATFSGGFGRNFGATFGG